MEMPDSSNLIVAEALSALVGDIVIVDCRFDLADAGAGRRAYEEAHIPGAVYADLDRDLAAPIGPATGRHPLPDPDILATTFGRLGIGRGTRVVVYDAANGGIAARCWWLLRWLGHAEVRLLDGGFSAWRAAGLPVESGIARNPLRSFAPNPRNDWILTTTELAAAVDGGEVRDLFDARDRTRYRGESEPIDPVAGHVPGARNLPFTDFLGPDGRWRDAESRRELWQRALPAGAGPGFGVMCGSGVTACHLVLSALEAGLPAPRLYVGSWSEWIRDPARPVALGDE